MFSGFSSSLKDRMPLEVPSEPESIFGQNQKVGIPNSFTAFRVLRTCFLESSYSLVTGCYITTI